MPGRTSHHTLLSIQAQSALVAACDLHRYLTILDIAQDPLCLHHRLSPVKRGRPLLLEQNYRLILSNESMKLLLNILGYHRSFIRLLEVKLRRRSWQSWAGW
jgi:hypothetical protein